jgi:plastocyanin
MFPPAVAVSEEAPTTVRHHPVYTHVAAAGLGFMALGLIIAIVVAIVSGVTIHAFEVIATVLPLVAAPLTWRFGRWATIVALVVTLLVGAGLFFLAFGLAYPASFGDFVPATSFVIGVVLGLGGAIAALVQRRRGNLTARLSARERRIIGGAGIVVVLAALMSTIMSITGGSTADQAAAAADGTPVTMSDFQFAEGRYRVTAGEIATLLVHNSDGFTHDLMIPALGIDAQTVLPGRDGVVEIAGAQPGTYTIYCSLRSNTSEQDPRTAGMAGTLVVE